MNYLPEGVVEQILGRLSSHGDRNSASEVCKSWYEVERVCRKRVLIRNCYAITPQRVLSRFPGLNSLSLKGKPHFADFNYRDWGAYLHPWVQTMVNAGVNLQELRLKRMIVSDETLHLISTAFPYFSSLLMFACQGFTTTGLASIASNCRCLKELDLQDCEVDDERGQWLSHFPDTCTTLTCLNFGCLKGQVSLPALESLVSRCPNLTTLKVNHSVPLESLNRILNLAPRLLHLGTGSFIRLPQSKYANFTKCTSLRSLSGFLRVSPRCLLPIYPLSPHLTSLDLSRAPANGIHSKELTNLIRYCINLEHLWILDTIGDKGLSVVASTCKKLQELRVLPSDHRHEVTEEGLVAVSAGCPNLNSIIYCCHQMTNAALITVAKNCPNFVKFGLCTTNPTVPDAVTQLPLDEGFGAIVQSSKGLRRLSISGHLTDQVFLYIGMYGEQLEMLSAAYAGETDRGMLYVLNGCRKLKKLEMRDCPFGDTALVADVGKYETVRSLFMSSCEVSLGACRRLARKMPRMNVEIINEQVTTTDETHKVDKVYLYRSLAGPRNDAPHFVSTL